MNSVPDGFNSFSAIRSRSRNPSVPCVTLDLAVVKFDQINAQLTYQHGTQTSPSTYSPTTMGPAWMGRMKPLELSRTMSFVCSDP